MCSDCLVVPVMWDYKMSVYTIVLCTCGVLLLVEDLPSTEILGLFVFAV